MPTYAGTRGYMAPEHDNDDDDECMPVQPTSDVFSLGHTMIGLLTGCYKQVTVALHGFTPAILESYDKVAGGVIREAV